MLNAARIFDFLADKAAAKQKTALVTVTDVTGASVRNPGAHMGVSDDGASIGSLSGGCIEAAVVAEALAAMITGAPHHVRYGAGSPIIDIRLPCGGTVDLLFSPIAKPDWARTVAAQMRQRHPALLNLPRTVGFPVLVDRGFDAATGWLGEDFIVRHAPPLRIVVLGHGGSVEALVGQAKSIEAEIEVITPDASIHARMAAQGVAAQLLTISSTPTPLTSDAWTAFVFYFHDHDWEGPLLAQALGIPSLYVGAMGSQKTHSVRAEHLRARAVPESRIAAIHAPIGLIPSSRDPETLALSTLAEIVQAYNAAVMAGPAAG
jgi:xanthine dehydrogenase accessory factor